MSVGNWNPSPSDQTINTALIDKALLLCKNDQLESLPKPFSDEECAAIANMMRLPESAWQEPLAGHTDENLRLLLRFFVRAEMQIGGCEAGEHSPAIWINRELKRRGSKLSREELGWIRDNTDNRFIPHGAL